MNLHNAASPSSSLLFDEFVYQVKLFVFYNVQTTHLTFVGKIQDNTLNTHGIAWF